MSARRIRAKAERSVRSVGGALAWLVVATACNSAVPPPHGSPVLLQVFWLSGDQSALVWSATPDATIVTTAPSYVTEVDFVFDRRIDGARVEDTSTDGGVLVTQPKAHPPVTVTWPGMPDPTKASATEPFSFVVQYNSVPHYGGASSYVFGRPTPPGLPSGTIVTFALAVDQLTSEYGDHALAPASIPVKTSAFAVAIGAPSTVVASTFQVPLVFSNRVAMTPPATSPFVHVRNAADVDVPYKLVADATQTPRWFLAPADCLGEWPASTSLTVTIDTGLSDVFGVPLALPATATFQTGTETNAAADCGAPGDGSVGDAPTETLPDAALDVAADAAADASDAATDEAIEAELDAGVDAVADADAPVDAAAD